MPQARMDADCVSIGPGMRRDQKPAAMLDGFENGANVVRLLHRFETALQVRRFFLPLALAAKQVVDAGFHLFRTVDVKRQIGNVARAHALQQFMANIAARGHQAIQGVGFFLLAAVHRNINQARICRRD